MELIKEIGAYAGLLAFVGLAVLALLSFSQGRDLRRLREWAGSAPERDAERKEATSAVASERADELRALEEARETERLAAEEREERRRRREAGLPEYTRGERFRERLAGGGSTLGEPRYLALIAIAVALVAGGAAFVLLQSDDDANGKRGKGGGAAVGQLRPSDVEVTVLNGTAVPGLAASYGDMVERRGYALGAVTNSTSSFEESVVMFEPGSAPEARRVADSLAISQVRPMSADIAAVSGGAPVSVVIGEDNASSAG